MIWPYSYEKDSLIRWRTYILFYILFGGLVIGSFSFIAGIVLAIKEKSLGLAIVDSLAVVLAIVLLFAHRIKFEIRALLPCLTFFIIGVAVILSVGPLSGGPAWLFAFATLASILLGNRAALVAILMNAVLLTSVGWLISTGRFGSEFPFFNTPQAMISTGVNFIVLNAIVAVSISALLKGLNTSEKRYRLIAENATDVIWTTNMDLSLEYISPSVYQLIGYTAEEYMKKPAVENLTPKSLDKVMELYGKKINQVNEYDNRGWDPAVFEAEQYCKDGTTIWANINARLIKGKDNKPEGMLGITRDITERKKNEQEKITAQILAGENEKLALVGRIAGKMAHDFNNVLGIIMGHTELALLKNDKESGIKKNLELIFNQTIRGKNLTKNLTAFAKSSEPRQKFFFINEKIEFVLNLIKNDLEEIQILKKDLKEVEILADPGMIEHALVNVFQNSIHALSQTELPKIIVRSYCRGEMAILEIEDNGCGIPQVHIEDIYEPFFTLKGNKDIDGSYKKKIKGTGYGLANVKKYIELHKGNILIESRLSSGTKVTVSLPLTQRTLTHEEKIQIQSAKKHSEKYILLVEDEDEISHVQYSILTQKPCNHKVDRASNGKTAIEMCDKNNYDLISLDYVLPGRINGKDVYDHIRKSNKSVPILFISGNIEFLESIRQLKEDDSYVEHLSKPCQNIEYINAINKLF